MKKKATIYVCSFPSVNYNGDMEILTSLWVYKPSSEDVTVHSTFEVEYDVPSRDDTVPAAVAALERKRDEVAADAIAKRLEIDGQIQSLLAIEHKEIA